MAGDVTNNVALEKLFVSIIVPVYNDAGRIGSCLDSLLKITYPSNRYEIIVVDNGSTDRSREIAQEFADRYGTVTLMTEASVQSPSVARNRGIQASRGEVVAFIDSDERADKNWLGEGIKCLQESKADLVGGRVILQSDHKTTAYKKYDELTAFNQEEFVSRGFAVTANLFVRRKVLENVGLFNPELLIYYEDNDFCSRATGAGYKLVYCESAITHHPVRETLASQLKRAFLLGKGRARYTQVYSKINAKWVFYFLINFPYLLKTLLIKRDTNSSEATGVTILAILNGLVASFSYVIFCLFSFSASRRTS